MLKYIKIPAKFLSPANPLLNTDDIRVYTAGIYIYKTPLGDGNPTLR